MAGRFAAMTCLVTLFAGCGGIPDYAGSQPTVWNRQPYTHMPDSDRLSVESLVIIPHTPGVETAVFGTYDRDVPGAADTAIDASTGPFVLSVNLAADLGGFAAPEILIPVLTLPWAIGGAAVGKVRSDLQEFRDAMTTSLVKDPRSRLSNTVIADDLYSALRHNPNTDVNVISPTTRLPVGTDYVLFAGFTGIAIEVDGGMAEIEIGASASLRRISDGKTLHSESYSYRDRDELGNWNANDLELWHDYLNFARHYLAREIAADFLERYELRHELQPVKTSSARPKDESAWHMKTRSEHPELAWSLNLLGGDGYGPWVSGISGESTAYDLEIYDRHRLIYTVRGLRQPSHQVTVPLNGCSELWWTVRPSYIADDGHTRYGEWMRKYRSPELDDGYVGREASAVPAFLRGFAVLKTSCRSF